MLLDVHSTHASPTDCVNSLPGTTLFQYITMLLLLLQLLLFDGLQVLQKRIGDSYIVG